ncbi:acyl-CoA thioesterase [Flammeovirga aprica]|uniref:Acyl-CoA thioesterase n=1 Tax=Flammeovirga aprica JL-4 TaxID=694437 RepID=A0A7X9RV42_9BACT|nr:thioesterase family protein [Flammeovirga aprica]NME69261.1 acyl-CoA thioesterase [Flammeovirga aprica JL-4]
MTKQTESTTGRVSKTTIKVRNYHIDSFQHVNNMRYMEFLEEARWCHFENNETLVLASKEDTTFVIANYNINFKFPASMHQELELHSQVIKVGGSSVTFHQIIYIKGTDLVALEADVVLVAFDIKTQKPKKISPIIKDELFK